MAFAVAFFGVALFAGCGKEQPKVDPSSPESYMKDEAFQNKLKQQDVTRRSLLKKFSGLRREYEAACAKDPHSPEAKALKAKLDATEDEYQANRKLTQAIVRDRLAPKRETNK